MIIDERVYDHEAYRGHFDRLADVPMVSLATVAGRRHNVVRG